MFKGRNFMDEMWNLKLIFNDFENLFSHSLCSKEFQSSIAISKNDDPLQFVARWRNLSRLT